MNTRTQASAPREVLQLELDRRRGANPRYSMRAFARALGLSPTVLSLVLNGKRPLSRKAAPKVALQLGLGPKERRLFVTRKATKSKESTTAQTATEFQQLSMDCFAVISDWYHYAILSLLDLPDARYEAASIARRLKITETDATAAMERLQRLGLVQCRGGRWRQSGLPLQIGNETTTEATRMFHRQLLARALSSLECDPFKERGFSSMTFAMDSKLVPFARERILEFRRKLVEELEAKGSPDRVYHLAVQIFPISHEEILDA